MRRGLAFAALAALWTFAAWLLWRTSVVPHDLRLPEVDPRGELGAAALHRAERFDRFLRWNLVCSQLALLVVVLVYARRGASFVRESAAGPIGTGMLLGMLGLGLVWLAQLPFQLASHWWQRRYGVAEGGYIATLFENWAALGGAFLFVCFALLVVMGLARRLGERWWLAGGPFFAALAVLFAFAQPYLVTGAQPLRDAALRRTIDEYERVQGLDHVPVRVERVSDLTNVPNAFATGIGPSNRIFLWDTLLDGRLSDAEVRVVVAHELGHLSRRHIPKGLAWYALLALPGAWAIARATRRRGGMGEPAAVPLGLAVLVVLQLAALPLQSAVSRHLEAEADWVALRTTDDPRAAAALFREFTRISLDDPSPPTWSYLLFSTHPTIEQRIAMARAFR